MSDSLKVTPADLTTSGQTVAWHTDDVAERHAAADALIEGATPGWTGASAAGSASSVPDSGAGSITGFTSATVSVSSTGSD